MRFLDAPTSSESKMSHERNHSLRELTLSVLHQKSWMLNFNP